METSVGGSATTTFRSQGEFEPDQIAWDAMVDRLRSEGRELVDDLAPLWVDPDGTEHYATQPIRPTIHADLPDETISRMRDVALRTLGWTLDEYLTHTGAQCHHACGVDPKWTRAERWAYEDVECCNFLLGEIR